MMKTFFSTFDKTQKKLATQQKIFFLVGTSEKNIFGQILRSETSHEQFIAGVKVFRSGTQKTLWFFVNSMRIKSVKYQ